MVVWFFGGDRTKLPLPVAAFTGPFHILLWVMRKSANENKSLQLMTVS